jgi:uncharacterized cofD-like protein
MRRKKIAKKARNWRGLSRLGWLMPGLGVKRWLIPILLGTTLLGVGLAILILDVYRTAPETWWLPLLSAASLRSLARPLRALIFGVLGAGLVISGIWGVNRALIAPYRRSNRGVLDDLTGHRLRERGPRIVTIGGGHGLSVLLRGLKLITNRLTAVVTVADDGGSSGRLRKTLGIPPPGDIRNCLAALSRREEMLTQLFQYRFPSGVTGLEGHSFGNLFIYALSEITGSFEEAIVESGRVLSVSGHVLPATLHEVRLVADLALPMSVGSVRVEGESTFPDFPGQVHRVWLEPNNPPAFPQVIQSILAADLVVIGPGSLYTSILPNLLVRDIAEAIRVSRALKIYVCNLTTQPGETDHFTCQDHIQAIIDHIGDRLVDIIVVNSNTSGKLPEGIEWVTANPGLDEYFPIYKADLVDADDYTRHDGEKLAKVIIDLLQERTGPLVE